MKITLVEDWKTAWKWSSMRLMALGTLLLTSAPHLVGLLADNWPSVAPWVMSFFPSAQQSIVPVIGLLLSMLARMTQIELYKGGSDGPAQ